MTQDTARDRSTWRIPLGLVAFSTIPLIAGSLWVLAVAGGPELSPTNPRIDASPTPLVLHVVAAAVYVVGGAFQFPARLRRGHPAWHRRAGRVLIGAGLVVAGSGLWMTLFCPDAPSGYLLWTVRLVVGSAMATSIVLGFTAIRRRDIAAHRAWMVRAYALAVAAGTQAFTQGIGEGAAPPRRGRRPVWDAGRLTGGRCHIEGGNVLRYWLGNSAKTMPPDRTPLTPGPGRRWATLVLAQRVAVFQQEC